MEIQQFTVVHLIDVIAAEYQHIFRILPFYRVNVLVHGVGRSLIPLFRSAKLRRNGEDEFAAVIGKNVPAQANVAIQRIGFVLGKDANSL